jgi:UDP-N-acetylmuramyl tripeptide synthase
LRVSRRRRVAAAARHWVASRLALVAGRLSRLTRRGSGSSITGRVLLLLSPGSLARLSRDRDVVLVSGTNGKSTTARLLAEAWRVQGPVTTNGDGANLAAGVASALLTSSHRRVVLEVDELALPEVIARTSPALVVLLNLARDQLDRVGEVSHHLRLWSAALRSSNVERLVVNADDPLLVAAATATPVPVSWVGAGLTWRKDAQLCQRCGGLIDFRDDGWSCAHCGLSRPPLELRLDEGTLWVEDAAHVDLDLSLPGRASRANAAMALAAARELGVDPALAAPRLARVSDVAGRFSRIRVDGRDVRLLLAKNPAGVEAVLDIVAPEPGPVVLAINAEAPDGRDPSWLWDAPFERLRRRPVVATGRRGSDLSVRLHYAGVEHLTASSVKQALHLLPTGSCDVIANYSAFSMARESLRAGAQM